MACLTVAEAEGEDCEIGAAQGSTATTTSAQRGRGEAAERTTPRGQRAKPQG